jgi:hypothetical protein
VTVLNHLFVKWKRGWTDEKNISRINQFTMFQWKLQKKTSPQCQTYRHTQCFFVDWFMKPINQIEMSTTNHTIPLYAPWDIYQHWPWSSPSFVGKYTSTMVRRWDSELIKLQDSLCPKRLTSKRTSAVTCHRDAGAGFVDLLHTYFWGVVWSSNRSVVIMGI